MQSTESRKGIARKEKIEKLPMHPIPIEDNKKKESEKQAWFDELVATIRSHQLQLESNTASPELEKLYESIFSGSADELVKQNKQIVQMHFIPKIIFEYTKLIKDSMPITLAFDFNDSELLVWAEINDDSFHQERELILSEAKINAKYHDLGFDMKSTIVECSDNLEVPNHYKIF